MTPLPQESRYTYADLVEWEGPTRYELYDGVPRAMSSPTDFHQEILIELATQLRTYLRGKRCRAYLAPFDVRLFESSGDRPEDVDTVVQPDLMVVCDQGKVDRHGVHGAPDLVIEILSSSTRRLDKLTKFRLYQEAGVKEYWVVDPETRTVSVHQAEGGLYGSPDVYTGEACVPIGVLDGCTIDLSLVFEG